jgi:hypothetical protein
MTIISMREEDGSLLDDGGNSDLLYDLGMSVMFPVNDSIESIVSISGVLYNTPGTIGFDEGVATLDCVTVTGFVLALDVTGVGVMDGVLEGVGGMGIVVVYDLLGDGDGGMGYSDGGGMGDGGGVCSRGGIGEGGGVGSGGSVGEGCSVSTCSSKLNALA